MLARPRALERHDAAESVGAVAREHVVLPASETPEVLARQVDAAAPPVLGDIAQDVRELEGEPEMHRVLASRRILVAEDLDRDEPDGARHAPAVLREVAVPRLVAVTPQVRLDTRDDRLEVLALDREVLDRVRQRDADRMARPARVHGVELGAPAREEPLGVARGTRLVGDVVGGAAEGVDGAQRAPPFRREQPEPPIEVRRRAACDVGAVLVRRVARRRGHRGAHRQSPRTTSRTSSARPSVGRRMKTS